MKELSKIKKVGLVVGAIFVFFVFLAIIGGSDSTDVSQNNVEQAQNEVEEVVEVSALQLSKDYDNNQVAADIKYQDKVLQITGVIDDIGKDILGTPYVTLEGTETTFFGVQCMFSRSQEGELATLSKGQNIVLKGKLSGEIIGSVIVKGCQIVGQ